MAAYPNFPQVLGSRLQDHDDLRVDEAVDGSARGRAFFPAVKRIATIVHLLSNADLATYKQFYSDHRLDDSVTVTWKPDCTTYNEDIEMIFMGPPDYQDDNPYTLVTATMREV